MFTAEEISTKTDKEIILEYLETVQKEIIEIALSKGMNASGKTLGSLEVKETINGGQLLAFSNIYFMEHGRGPTKASGSGGGETLTEIIAQWIQDKGLDLNPYAVAKTIHAKGTKLYRAGGKSGVLSIPLRDDRLEQVIDALGTKYLQKVSSQIFQPINDFRK